MSISGELVETAVNMLFCGVSYSLIVKCVYCRNVPRSCISKRVDVRVWGIAQCWCSLHCCEVFLLLHDGVCKPGVFNPIIVDRVQQGSVLSARDHSGVYGQPQ